MDASWEEESGGTYKVTINSLRSINYWPYMNITNRDEIEDVKAAIDLDKSGLNFKVDVKDSSGNVVSGGTVTYNWKQSNKISCVTDPSISGSWRSKEHHGMNKRVICTLKDAEIMGLSLTLEEEYTIEASIQIIDPSGTWGGPFDWQTSDACRESFYIEPEPFDDTLTCDALTADGSGSITVIPGQSASAELETDIGGTLSSGSITYEYDADYGTASGSTGSMTAAQSEVLDPGTYDDAIWVTIGGGGLSRGGQGTACTVDLVVQQGECDCESIVRSPSTDEIAAGSNVWFQITDSCNLSYSDVSWFWSEGEDGTAQTTNFSDRDPSSSGDPAVNHGVMFSVPDDASGTVCVWARTEGVDDPDCKDCFTIGGEENPAFAAVKTSEMVCINNNTAARITYTIQVRNISDVSGVIEYVEDTYDSRIQSSWVGSITPTPDSHTGNVIRWDNDDNGYTLAANDGSSGGSDEIEFSYIVTVPAEYFGTYVDGVFDPYEYRNHVIVKPEDQDAIDLRTVVEIVCGVPTGVFDKAVTSILLGLLFVMLGGVLLRTHKYTYKYVVPIERILKENYLTRSVKRGIKYLREDVSDRMKLTKKERFEKKAVKKTEGEK
jgi:hypothetical protein